MKAIHWRIKVTYNFEKKVNQKVNLGQRQMPARPDIAISKDGLFEKPVEKSTFVQKPWLLVI